jgi:hypothetical protein
MGNQEMDTEDFSPAQSTVEQIASEVALILTSSQSI